MGLNLDAVGKRTLEFARRYDWKDVVLYALGVGASSEELGYLYEARGPMVLPTYAVVPAYAAQAALLQAIGGNYLGVVHSAQTVRLHRPFAPSATLRTTGVVDGIYDLKRMAQVVISTRTLDQDGVVICETSCSMIYRLDGGFGGPPPPRPARFRPPAREPDFVCEDRTTPEQAVLYRLSGDLNPLHIDPDTAEQAGFGRPILHGLCTYGFVGRALLRKAAGGDPARFKTLSGQFRRPVWPGETLVTQGWHDEGKWLLRAYTLERPKEYVFGNAYAELS